MYTKTLLTCDDDANVQVRGLREVEHAMPTSWILEQKGTRYPAPLDASIGLCHDRGMSKPEVTSPTFWMVLGAAVIVATGYLYDEVGWTPLTVASLAVGAALALFGVVAKAIELGVRSARDRDD